MIRTTAQLPPIVQPVEHVLELILCAMEFVVMELLLKRNSVTMEQAMDNLLLAAQ
jgi:hypothetical protein